MDCMSNDSNRKTPKYWVERWSKLRNKEMISYPKDFPINGEFVGIYSEEKLRSGFEELFRIMQQIYKDASLGAAKMLLPCHDMEKYSYLSKEERASRIASFKYAKFLFALGKAGELNANAELCIRTTDFKHLCKELQITGINGCLAILENYGFVFDGLVNGKVKDGNELVLMYPDNCNVLFALHIMAVKAENTGKEKDFYRLNYRLLKDGWNKADFGYSVDVVADLLSEKDKETAYLIHEELMRRNYCFNFQEWNEGPQIRYFRKEAECKRNANAAFWMASMDTSLRLYFRMKNIDEGISLIEQTPESVIKQFLISDSGCVNRSAGRCVSGISYELCGKSIWRCGCCYPNFQVTPHKEDYLLFIDLVESVGRK